MADKKKAEQKTEREYKDIVTLRGEVKILEAGEIFTAVTAVKAGREIGEDNGPTIEFFDPTEQKLFILPAHHVLKNTLDQASKHFGGDYFSARVIYEGKITPEDTSKKPYHKYRIQAAEALDSEREAIATFEAAQL